MIYEEEIKNIIKERFDPSIGKRQELMTTDTVCHILGGVIPKDYFNEDDIYQILKELGFKQDLHVVYDVDDNEKETDEIIDQYLVWVFYQK